MRARVPNTPRCGVSGAQQSCAAVWSRFLMDEEARDNHGEARVLAAADSEEARVLAAADSEALILVDEADREVGHLSKTLCHEGRGVLHRAFSLLIFNDRGEL